MTRALRWWSLLLVPGGFVAGHELGYQWAALLGHPAVLGGGEHGYLALTVLVGIPFGFAAVARSLIAGLRDELPPVRLGTLPCAQAALFLAVELAEHARAGLAPAETVAQPAVALGLVAQLAVATLLHLVIRSSHEAALAVAARRRRRAGARPARPAWVVTAVLTTVSVVPFSSVSRRGPPALAT